eukprot:scaffold171435_cov32-Tisochrysis_lutea.AAC.3
MYQAACLAVWSFRDRRERAPRLRQSRPCCRRRRLHLWPLRSHASLQRLGRSAATQPVPHRPGPWRWLRGSCSLRVSVNGRRQRGAAGGRTHRPLRASGTSHDLSASRSRARALTHRGRAPYSALADG